MRLDMKTRKKICEAIYRRYRKAGKKGKGKILDEYVQTLGYNRVYVARLLANRGKNRYAHVNGKLAKYTAKAPAERRQKAPGGAKTGRPEKLDI